jgi:mRNA-degrading endonuclease toxin of MazEF toxin-antitoxin module
MKRGDVIIVDFLFSDRTGSKVRPALVVQADDFNARLSDTIIGSFGVREGSFGVRAPVVISKVLLRSERR